MLVGKARELIRIQTSPREQRGLVVFVGTGLPACATSDRPPGLSPRRSSRQPKSRENNSNGGAAEHNTRPGSGGFFLSRGRLAGIWRRSHRQRFFRRMALRFSSDCILARGRRRAGPHAALVSLSRGDHFVLFVLDRDPRLLRRRVVVVKRLDVESMFVHPAIDLHFMRKRRRRAGENGGYNQPELESSRHVCFALSVRLRLHRTDDGVAREAEIIPS
jgi:hypothetical protein